PGLDKGVAAGGGKPVKYGDLPGNNLFNASRGPTTRTQFQAPANPTTSYKLVGTRPPRLDIPDKVTGVYAYVHNVRVPGMLHARLIRPRGQAAYGTGVKILSVDPSSISHIPNPRILQKANFLAVVAPKED